jgi:hypothetical protein
VPNLEWHDLDGRPISLRSQRAAPAVLAFWNPRCGFCQHLIPAIRAWEASNAVGDHPLLFVSTGTPEENRALAFDAPIILEDDFSTARLFGATGTPAAVLIGSDGRVAGPIAKGGPAVLDLLRVTRENRPVAG